MVDVFLKQRKLELKFDPQIISNLALPKYYAQQKYYYMK